MHRGRMIVDPSRVFVIAAIVGLFPPQVPSELSREALSPPLSGSRKTGDSQTDADP